MSRSHRKFPIFHFVGADSQASWKRSYNRTLRRKEEQCLAIFWEDEDLIFLTLDQVADPWLSPRDGSGRYTPFRTSDHWWTNPNNENLHFSYFRAVLMK